MAWKKKYGVTRRLKAKKDPEYRARRNQQSCTDREARKRYMREYYSNHPEKFKRRTPEQRARYNAKRRKMYSESEEIRRIACAEAKCWREQNPRKSKATRLRPYGITIEQFEEKFLKQGGKCAICGHSDTSEKLFFPVVDHCHKRNVFRGILCMNCNQGLGKFRDDITLLRAAIKYLQTSAKVVKQCQSSTK